MTNENFDFENMRQQMTTLKNKLNKQEIVNDRLIRHSMKNTAGHISRRYYMIMALCLLMLPYSSLPTDASLQLLGICEVERFLHSFLDFHLHRHAD